MFLHLPVTDKFRYIKAQPRYKSLWKSFKSFSCIHLRNIYTMPNICSKHCNSLKCSYSSYVSLDKGGRWQEKVVHTAIARAVSECQVLPLLCRTSLSLEIAPWKNEYCSLLREFSKSRTMVVGQEAPIFFLSLLLFFLHWIYYSNSYLRPNDPTHTVCCVARQTKHEYKTSRRFY